MSIFLNVRHQKRLLGIDAKTPKPKLQRYLQPVSVIGERQHQARCFKYTPFIGSNCPQPDVPTQHQITCKYFSNNQLLILNPNLC